MTWELFIHKKASFGKPKVTILRSGGILLNKNFIEEFIKDKKFLNLYYHSSAKMIGIKPVDIEETYSYKVRDDAAKSGLTLSAISFFGKYKVNYTAFNKRTYDAVWDEEQGMATITHE